MPTLAKSNPGECVRSIYNAPVTKSPFPGMDPYLEAHWLDVYTSLVSGARDALNRSLPEDLVASAEERVAVESPDEGERLISPDVQVIEPMPRGVESSKTSSSTLLHAPFRLLVRLEPITERFIRVLETGTGRLITVIEFVSPTNKRDEGLVSFRAKRAELLAADVNFVEIDLVRAGNWRALLRPHVCPPNAVMPYRATIRVPGDPGAVYFYPITLRDPLPSLVIPLRPVDPEVCLQLQTLLDSAYNNGRYARRLDYSAELKIPFDREDTEWAAQRAREKTSE